MKRLPILIISGALIAAPFFALAETPNASVVAALEAQIKVLQALVVQLHAQVQAVLASRGALAILPQQNLGPFSIRVHSDGLATTVVKGSQAETLAHIVIDASGTTENVKAASLPLILRTPDDNSQEGLNTCQIFDGGVSLTMGSHIVNPTASKLDEMSYVFTFDTDLVIPAKSVKTLAIKCNIIQYPPAPATYAWGIGDVSTSFTGAASNKIVVPTKGSSMTRSMMLISDGSFVVELGSSSPAARTVTAGSSDVTATVLDLYAAGEAVELQTLGLKVDGPNNFVVTRYTIWDGATKVGEGSLTDGNRNITAKLSSGIIIPRDAHKLLTIKVDLALLSARVQAGDTVAINFNGANGNFNLTQGLGKSSGVGIIPSSQRDTAAAFITVGATEAGSTVPSLGVQQVVYEKLPTVHSSSVQNGLIILYRFKVAAGAGKVVPTSFNVSITRSLLSFKDFELHAYTDPNFHYKAYTFNPISHRRGILQETVMAFPLVIENTGMPFEVPAGEVRYFELRATVLGSNPGATITVGVDAMPVETIWSL